METKYSAIAGIFSLPNTHNQRGMTTCQPVKKTLRPFASSAPPRDAQASQRLRHQEPTRNLLFPISFCIFKSLYAMKLKTRHVQDNAVLMVDYHAFKPGLS